MSYLRTAPARYRWGVSIIEAFDADGHVIRYPYERLSVRPPLPVPLFPVPAEDDGLLAVAFIGVLLAVGMFLGWLT